LSTDAAKALTDKKVLMIVKKIQRADELSDDVVEIVRITDDVDLIKQFYLNDNNFTPAKVFYYKFHLLLMWFLISTQCVR
jgi:hypothetical protein